MLTQKNIPLLSNFFPSDSKSKIQIKIIPHYISSEEYTSLFHISPQIDFPEKEKISEIFAVFSSPLNEDWKEVMACKGDEQFAIRTGFYRDEFEIYQSILMGFQGLTIYVAGLDLFQIQYLTEIARDYLFSLFFVVHNKEELNLVLQTDAPYIVFSAYKSKNFSIHTSIFYNLSQFVPKTANLFALAPREVLKNIKNFENLGYSGLIVS